MANPGKKSPCSGCKYRKLVPYSSHHVQCTHPDIKLIMAKCFFITSSGVGFAPVFSHLMAHEMGLTLNKHGVNKGWCTFPEDFDEIWIEGGSACKLKVDESKDQTDHAQASDTTG